MSIKKRLSATTAGALIAAAAPVALVASGSPASAACIDAGKTYYTVSASAIRMPFKGVPVFKDGPGGTIQVSRAYSGSVSYQVTAGAESEVGAVLAKAKVSVSASLTKSNSTTTTHTYSHRITAGKYGNVRYVSWGKKVAWKKYRYDYRCYSQFVSSGTINFPSTAEGWFYWETSY